MEVAVPARRRQLGSLPIQRAFVVHLVARRAGRRRFMGRVEHLPSGRATTFFSLAELLRFMERAPDEPEGTAQGGGSKTGSQDSPE